MFSLFHCIRLNGSGSTIPTNVFCSRLFGNLIILFQRALERIQLKSGEHERKTNLKAEETKLKNFLLHSCHDWFLKWALAALKNQKWILSHIKQKSNILREFIYSTIGLIINENLGSHEISALKVTTNYSIGIVFNKIFKFFNTENRGFLSFLHYKLVVNMKRNTTLYSFIFLIFCLNLMPKAFTKYERARTENWEVELWFCALYFFFCIILLSYL